MYFKRAHRVETQQNIELVTFAVTWSANIFVGCSVTPTFFSADHSLFRFDSDTKKRKKSVRGKFWLFLIYYSNRVELVHGCRCAWLRSCLFKANYTWIDDICSKDLSNRPIYAVLNTHNLDMILQLKYMPIVMNPARIASSDWKY